MLHNVLKKADGSQTAILPATVLTAFQIHRFTFVCFITPYLAVVERHRSALDLVLNCVVRSPQMLGYSVDRPSVLAANLNFVSFFAQKVLTFAMFCGMIGIVHSNFPFGIVV